MDAGINYWRGELSAGFDGAQEKHRESSACWIPRDIASFHMKGGILLHPYNSSWNGGVVSMNQAIVHVQSNLVSSLENTFYLCLVLEELYIVEVDIPVSV